MNVVVDGKVDTGKILLHNNYILNFYFVLIFIVVNDSGFCHCLITSFSMEIYFVHDDSEDFIYFMMHNFREKSHFNLSWIHKILILTDS